MRKQVYFGMPFPEYRTDYGSLRGRECERIIDFLTKRGILVSDYYGRLLVIVHPCIADEVKVVMSNNGFSCVLLCNNTASLYSKYFLKVKERRVIEEFAPGRIIVDSQDENQLPVSIPDSMDLRDLCSVYNGFITAFLADSRYELSELINLLDQLQLDSLNNSVIGVLENPWVDEKSANYASTIVKFHADRDVEIIQEGDVSGAAVIAATKHVSLTEIGEWS